MDFLMKYNITEKDILEIKNSNSKGIINNIIVNQKNVCEIIEYLQELGVNKEVVKNLFMNQVGIFFKTKEELVLAFDEYEMDSIIKSLNYDVNTLDLIEFN